MSNPDFARPCLAHNDTSYYIALAKRLDDEELCNMLLTLIHQTISMIGKMIDLVKRDFLVTGGIKEQMLNARISYRNTHDPEH